MELYEMQYEHKPLRSSWVDTATPKPMHDVPPSAVEIWHEKHNQIDVENLTIIVTFEQGLVRKNLTTIVTFSKD